MKENLLIRKATLNDIENLLSLHQENFLQKFDSPWNRKQFCDFFQQDWGKMFLASFYEKNNFFAKFHEKIVGMVAIMETPESIEILTIAVASNFKRQGIATQMFEYLFQKYIKKNFFLEVVESNFSAINLYKKLGFIEINKRKKYYFSQDKKESANALVMRFNLFQQTGQ
ncbi:MAG: GNAT family N-acetyltransferase [Holosporales bacterium]|jgi:ribosomal-protein-alanine N-acetyltransferase|nr:GNAT family N-acetyltransferase [Holosporales bacterium]